MVSVKRRTSTDHIKEHALVTRTYTAYFKSTVVPPYPWVICSKTYHGYMKPQIIPNTTYNMVFV
jgi:hypothetical protein